MILSQVFAARLDGWLAADKPYAALEELQRWVEDGLDEGRFDADQVYADEALALRVAALDEAAGDYECFWHARRWLEKLDSAARTPRWYAALVRACLYTGDPERALELAADGTRCFPRAGELAALSAMLLAHFGHPDTARLELEEAYALLGEGPALARLAGGVRAGAPLEELVLWDAADEQEIARRRALGRGMVPDEAALERVKRALNAREWAFEAPWCLCRVPFGGGLLDFRLCMDEAEAARQDTARLTALLAALPRLDEAIRPLVAQKHRGLALGLTEVLLRRDGAALLGYHVGRCPAEPLYAYGAVGPDLVPPNALSDQRWPAVWFDAPPAPLTPLGEGPRGGYTAAQRAAVLRHITTWYGAPARLLPAAPGGVEVCLIPPGRGRQYQTLVTLGMGGRPMHLPPDLADSGLERAELLILLPADWRVDGEEERWHWPLRWLRLLAGMPADQDTWLGWGHTIPAGRPFAPNTRLSGILLADPLDAAEPAAICPLPQGGEVNFYQMLPLYPEEMDAKLERDAETLLDEMEDAGLLDRPWVDVTRPPLGGGPAAPADPALLEQVERWRLLGQDEAIVQALSGPAARDAELAGLLARSLNDLGRWEQAEAVLQQVEQAGACDPLWHFRMGFACYYTGRLSRALACFEAADRLAPGDGDTETYLGWCRSALELPVCTEPFAGRVEAFWADFSRQERALFDAGCDAALPVVRALLGRCFADPRFRLEPAQGRLRLTILADDDLRRMLAARWRGAAPAALAARWEFCAPDPAQAYTGYEARPRRAPREVLRQDVVAGTTCLPALVEEFLAGGQALADEALAHGAVLGFLCCDAGPADAGRVARRAALEEELARRAGPLARVLGGAVGARHCYIDLLIWDLEPFLDLAAGLPAFAGGSFQVFRPAARAVALKPPREP